jgi:hypothetical protein
MFVRVVNIKFSSRIEADAMHALAKHEMINNLPGVLSIELISITELHSIAINKFDNKESADKSKEIYINKMKSNPNIKVEIFEGDRSFIVEKS